jgi:hypothetical protein
MLPDGQVTPAAAATAGSDVRLRLLDGFELRRDATPVELALSAQRLITSLTPHGDRPIGCFYVAGTVRLDASGKRSHINSRAAP